MVALVLVTLVIAVITGDRAIRRAAAVAALAVIVVAAGYATVKLVDGQTLDDLTSDRTNRVEYTLRVVEHYPIAGVGLGGQARIARDLAGSDRPTPLFVSHTTPLTVPRSWALIGLLLYAWLMVGGTRAIVDVGPSRASARPGARRVLARAVRARLLLQRLPRGPDHLARARRRRPAGWRRTRRASRPRRSGRRRRRAAAASVVSQRTSVDAWLLGAARASSSRSSRSRCRSSAPIPGASGRRRSTRRASWRRSCAPRARSGTSASRAPAPSSRRCCCGAAAIPLLLGRRWPRLTGPLLVLAVGLLLMLPSTLLQLGLRQATEPWFFTNDSTYQIELAGDLIRDGDDPYGHDYRGTGLERFYTRDGSVSQRVLEREVALDHYAYFPGTAITSVPWGLLPHPFDDYRLFVLLCTLATLAAALAFRGAARLAAGARRAAGLQPDRGALRLVRPERRAQPAAAGARLRARSRGAASAGPPRASPARSCSSSSRSSRCPSLALMLVHAERRAAPSSSARRSPSAAWSRVGVLPFLVWDPVAFYEDTVKYGAGTYKIVGYGLSAMLVRAGILDDRDGSYPFALIALLTWLPLTVWLLLDPAPLGRALDRRRRLRALDPVADVHRPDVQQLLPDLAADRRGYRRAACLRGFSAYWCARPVT